MCDSGAMTVDKRAIKILMNTYWSAEGWQPEPVTSPDDLAYAKSHHVMFDPIVCSHEDAATAVVQAVSASDQANVVQAFIASLGSRRLDLRSGLGSYAVGRHFQNHSARIGSGRTSCSYCGTHLVENVDLNVLNFERFKWGGVRHDQPAYIAFDLRLLHDTPLPSPTTEDFMILRRILSTAASMKSNARLGHLENALSKVLASNRAERRVLISILGYAGILVDPSRPAFRLEFVPDLEREQTPYHRDDWPYPVQWWNGSFGVNVAAVNDWFPTLSAQELTVA